MIFDIESGGSVRHQILRSIRDADWFAIAIAELSGLLLSAVSLLLAAISNEGAWSTSAEAAENPTHAQWPQPDGRIFLADENEPRSEASAFLYRASTADPRRLAHPASGLG
jgi:hypothetical protein